MTPEGSPRPRGPFARDDRSASADGRFCTSDSSPSETPWTIASERSTRFTALHQPEARLTLGVALERLLATKTKSKSLYSFRGQARHLCEAFGINTLLSAITAPRIAEYQASRSKAGIAAGGINRPLSLLRHVLRTAHLKWEVLSRVPHVETSLAGFTICGIRSPVGRFRLGVHCWRSRRSSATSRSR